MCFSPGLRDLPCLAFANGNALLSVAVPPHCCYVLPRPTEAGGAIIGRHGPSGLGHITWEDLSACTAAHSTA